MFFTNREKNIFDAHEYYLSGKYVDALELCEQILAHNPDRYSAINLIANIYFMSGDFDKGEQYIFKLRDFFVKRDEYDKALAAITRLRKMKPEREDYIREMADIYDKSGRAMFGARQYMQLADVHRRNGKFKTAAEVYLQIAEQYPGRPELIKNLLNKLALIGAASELGKLVQDTVLTSDMFEQSDVDDAILLCIQAGCRPDIYIRQIPNFLKGGDGRLYLLEDVICKYFISEKDDELLIQIIEAAGYNDCVELLDRIAEISPDNIPLQLHMQKMREDADRLENDEAVAVIEEELSVEADEPVQDIFAASVPDEEPELSAAAEESEPVEIHEQVYEPEEESAPEELHVDTAIQIESHHQDSVAVDVPQLELDTYQAYAGESHVDASLSGLERFESEGDIVDVQTLDTLETYDIKPVDTAQATHEPEPEVDRDLFAHAASRKAPDDVFAAFDTPSETTEKDIFADFASEAEPAADDDFFAVKEDESTAPAQQGDMLEDLMPAEEHESVHEVEQIDMSEAIVETGEKEDMFAGLVEEAEVEVIEKKPAEKIIIDENELQQHKDKDIFDMEV